jgi:hypothetical protein
MQSKEQVSITVFWEAFPEGIISELYPVGTNHIVLFSIWVEIAKQFGRGQDTGQEVD